MNQQSNRKIEWGTDLAHVFFWAGALVFLGFLRTQSYWHRPTAPYVLIGVPIFIFAWLLIPRRRRS